jgi:hypothetical protein
MEWARVLPLFSLAHFQKKEKKLTTTWSEEDVNTYHPNVDTSAIFNAPDYASMLKHTSSASAKEYTAKINAMLKTGVVASIRSGNEADAAAILHFGPGFAEAMGDLTDISDKTKKFLDILTAPESPVVAVLFTAIPMAMQLMRNHERQIEQVSMSRKEMRQARKEAKARGETIEKQGVQVKLPFGRSITLPIRVKLNLWSNTKAIFQAQTYAPEDLTKQVFSDDKVIAALRKMKVVRLWSGVNIIVLSAQNA